MRNKTPIDCGPSPELHHAVLKCIEVLWGAECGTASGKALDMLVDAIVAYENEHCPIPSQSDTESV